MSWHIVNGADEDTIALESHLVLVVLCIIETERFIYGSALIHELDGTAWISRNVADCDQS